MDISDQDQEIDPNDARWGRPIEPGDYPVEVIDVKEGFTNGNKPKTQLTLLVCAPAEKTPEGPVKIDYHCVVGQTSLRNMLQVFEPQHKLGTPGKFDTSRYVGAKLTASVRMGRERNGYPAKAEIGSLKGPVTFATARTDAGGF